MRGNTREGDEVQSARATSGSKVAAGVRLRRKFGSSFQTHELEAKGDHARRIRGVEVHVCGRHMLGVEGWRCR